MARFARTHWAVILVNAVSIYLAACCWNPYDVRYFITWHNEYFAQGRLLEVYTGPPEEKVAYFPLSVLIFVSFHELAVRLSSNEFVWKFIDKIPLLLSFNAVYFILNKKYGKKAGYAWLLSLANYSVIGAFQFDQIIALFVLLALLALEAGNFTLYGVYVSLAALVKQPLAMLLVVPVAHMFKERRFRDLIKYIGTSAAVLAIFILPFFLVNPTMFLLKTLFFHTKRFPQYSIWAAPYYFSGFNPDVIPSWFHSAWLVVFGIFIVWFLLTLLRERSYSYITFLKYIIVLIAGFLATTKVNNLPYILWMAPPLIIFVSICVSKHHKISERLVRAYLFSNIIAIAMPALLTFPSIVAAFPVYIPEDHSWVPADKLAVDCCGSHYVFYYLALYLRSIPFVREYFVVIASASHYIVGVLCVAYTVLLVYIIFELTRENPSDQD